MEKKIDEYFDSCDEKNKPYTVPGIAYYLGFADRSSMYNYGEKPEFSYILKKARQKIEDYYNQILISRQGQVAGLIFLLKNHFDYRDQKDVSVAHSYDKNSENIDFTDRIPSKNTQQEQGLVH